MTTNERLFHFGLLDQFDHAARMRDRFAMISILADAKVDDPERVADVILKTPEKYSF